MSPRSLVRSRAHRLLAMLAAMVLLLSLGSAWLRGDGGLALSAVQTAQLFLGPLAWLLLPLLVAGLGWLLVPLHAMWQLAARCALLALPIWLVLAAWLVVDVQHLAPAWGLGVAGLALVLLSASSVLELQSAPRPGAGATDPLRAG